MANRHMYPRRKLMRAVAISIAVAAAASLQAQKPPIKPSSPAVVGPPQWSRVLPMPDGRTFVTDGGLSVDVKYAKPATMPSTVLPEHSGKIIADRMMAPHDKEIGLGELTVGTFKNSFATPDGVSLNGNYVSFLRERLPSKTRLRTRGKSDPVTIVIDGQAVGIMMPLAPAK